VAVKLEEVGLAVAVAFDQPVGADFNGLTRL
jgi:hypothetical protein